MSIRQSLVANKHARRHFVCVLFCVFYFVSKLDMFKKPKRNFRSRRKNSESGNEDNAESKTENARADISCSNVAEPGKNNLNSRSGNEPVAIVIDDDDATETFNVSESVQSQTSTKQNKSKSGVPRVTSLTSLSSVLSFDTGDHDDGD